MTHHLVRRRASLQQGRALETLGHAVEYLLDSRLFRGQGEPDDQEAVQILMRLSRAVFSECAEVVPLHERFARWIQERRGGTDRRAAARSTAERRRAGRSTA